MIFLLFQFETIESLAIYANIDYFFAGPLNGGFRFFVYSVSYTHLTLPTILRV